MKNAQKFAAGWTFLKATSRREDVKDSKGSDNMVGLTCD